MKFAVADFETFYSADYTLGSMTTEAYVRDGRFKAHCMAVKVMDTLPALDDNAPIPVNVFNGEDWRRFGAPLVPDYACVFHNAAFDGLILSHHYGVQPAFYFDTLAMSRLIFPHARSHSLSSLASHFGLPEKIVPYNEFKGVRDLRSGELYDRLAAGCAHDVELTWQIFRKLLPLVPREELRIIDMTVRMFTQPELRLDYDKMEAYHAQVKRDKEAVLSALGVTKESLQSSARFAEILIQLGVDPPVKRSPKNPDKVIYAFAKTDQGMKDLCDDEDDRVAVVCTARLGEKSTLNETRCERLLRMAERGSLTVPLRYYGAGASGRFSGEDKVNFQNFPRSGEIRSCIMAPRGHVLLVGDLAQVECRVLNWLAGERWVLDAFREGRDLYSELASKFYGREISKATPAERGMGKQVELSCGFGSGGDKIVETARRGTYGPPVILTKAEGLAWRDLYRATHPGVKTLWDTGAAIMGHLFAGTETQWGCMHVRDKKLYGPTGAWLDYSNLVYKGSNSWGKPDWAVLRRQGESRIYGSKFIQNVVEFLSRAILVKAALRMHDHFRCALLVHDETVHIVPKERAEEAKAMLQGFLTDPATWCPDLPLEAECAYSERYEK